MGSGVGESVRARVQAFGQGLSWMGIRSARSMEEEGGVEGPLEESVEDGEKANLGAVQETRMERRLETDLEAG